MSKHTLEEDRALRHGVGELLSIIGQQGTSQPSVRTDATFTGPKRILRLSEPVRLRLPGWTGRTPEIRQVFVREARLERLSGGVVTVVHVPALKLAPPALFDHPVGQTTQLSFASGVHTLGECVVGMVMLPPGDGLQLDVPASVTPRIEA